MMAGSLSLPSSMVLRARHLTFAIRALGPRPLHELFCDLIVASSAALDLLEAYARLDPQIVRQLGGDKLPGLQVVK
jgi:hypothetical protein